MEYGSPKWKAKILDPATAIKWALEMSENEGEEDAIVFLNAWKNGALLSDEWSEYRYWATSTHEPLAADVE